jgi:hypothetical protein
MMGVACMLSAQHTITGFEYWFDDAHQDRVWVPAAQPENTIDTTLGIDVSGLPLGVHYLRVRLRDVNGVWSSVLWRMFTKDPGVPNELQLLRYWSQQAQQDPTDMVVMPFNDPAQLIDIIANLDFCTYTQTGATRAFFQLKDSRSQWSSVIARDINVDVVGQAPGMPGAISGPSMVLAGNEHTYSVPAVPGASYYVWTLPNANWTGTSSTNSITVTAGSGGDDGLITVTAWNACGSSTTVELYVTVSGMGIEDVDASSGMSLFPNPTSGNFTLRLPAHAQARELYVHDATGRLVLSQPIANASGPVTVDLSGHENGLYLVQVRFADGTRAVERVVKE